MKQVVQIEAARIGSIIIQQAEGRYIVRFSKDSESIFDYFDEAVKAAWDYVHTSGMEL